LGRKKTPHHLPLFFFFFSIPFELVLISVFSQPGGPAPPPFSVEESRGFSSRYPSGSIWTHHGFLKQLWSHSIWGDFAPIERQKNSFFYLVLSSLVFFSPHIGVFLKPGFHSRPTLVIPAPNSGTGPPLHFPGLGVPNPWDLFFLSFLASGPALIPQKFFSGPFFPPGSFPCFFEHTSKSGTNPCPFFRGHFLAFFFQFLFCPCLGLSVN